jgi:hypothetical protein
MENEILLKGIIFIILIIILLNSYKIKEYLEKKF